MKRRFSMLWGALAGGVALHEAAFWALGQSDVPSVLFAPGSHTPFVYLALSVGFVLLRLCLYFVVPGVIGVWAALRIEAVLSAAAARRASGDGSSTRASQQRSFARGYPSDPPHASHPGSST